jgi:hypothetical protein
MKYSYSNHGCDIYWYIIFIIPDIQEALQFFGPFSIIRTVLYTGKYSDFNTMDFQS